MRPSTQEKCLHFEKVLTFLNNDRKSEKRFCNKTLCSQGKNFAVHDGILASMSDYFDALLGGEMSEKYSATVKMDKIPPKRLESLLDYIYTGDIELTEENVLEVLEDSDYTQLTGLKSFSSEVILKIISTENCLKIRAHACRYNLDDVQIKTNQIIVDNLETVVQQRDFLLLDAGDVSTIFKETKKENMEAVFNGMVCWVNFNPSLREEFFVELFFKLDLSNFSTEFLTATIKNEHLIRKQAECCSAVLDATVTKLTGHASKYSQGDFILVGGNGSQKECMKYNVITKQGIKLPNLIYNRIWSTSAKVGKRIYVMGGEGPTSHCEMMDLNECEHWVQIADMQEPRNAAASCALEELIYVSGGIGDNALLSSCCVYNTTNGTWKHCFDMLHPRYYHGMCMSENSIYFIGGHDGSQCLLACERFDPRSKSSFKIASLNQARSCLFCVQMNDAIYAIGGYFKDSFNIVEKYDPRADKWENIAALLSPRHRHSACVVNGRIYVVGGGRGSFNEFKSVEVYDPTTNVWAQHFDLENPVWGANVLAL